MGTNYYTDAEPVCEHCGKGGEELHIGKASAGWQFLFAAYPEHNITSWAEWQAFLRERPIRDEYGEKYSLVELCHIVECRKDQWDGFTSGPENYGPSDPGEHECKDADGYRFSRHADFS